MTSVQIDERTRSFSSGTAPEASTAKTTYFEGSMKEPKLSIADLKVESFETLEDGGYGADGTVFGQSILPDSADCSNPAQCNETSDGCDTNNTCIGNTCTPTCDPTYYGCQTAFSSTCDTTISGGCRP